MGDLQFKNINKVYPNGFHAVHDFNLDIKDGEFVVFVGPSGCGKSTILRMEAGLEEISSGELLMDYRMINNLSPVDRDIAVVFQDYALYGNMTVYDNIGISDRLRHQKDTDSLNRIINVSELFGLEALLNRIPGQLSGGQKQRVALARSVMRHPNAFLMDEPLSNLDAKLRASARREIVKLHNDLGVTTIYVTHDQTEAMTMADRIVVLKDGVVQQIGTPEEIYNHPTNLFVAGFIGSPLMNFMDGVVDGEYFVFGEHKLKLPKDILDRLQDYIGEKLVLGIRPECTSCASEQDENVVSGILENNEYFGSSNVLYVKVDDKNALTCRTSVANSSLKVGQKIGVKFDMDRLYFFDSETTLLILDIGVMD